MKAVILDGYALNPGDLSWEPLKALFETTKLYDRTPADQIVSRIGDADAVFTNKCTLTADIIDRCPNLKYIGEMATGYNNIDIAHAAEKQIVCTNVPAYSTDSVAQHTFALLFALTNRVQCHSNWAKQNWPNAADFCYWLSPVCELSGKVMGLVGYGSIARRTAQIALALGMQVQVYTPHPKKEEETDRLTFVSMDTLLKNSDVVSLHCPLTADNQNLMDKTAFSKMKPNAVLINTARGGLVDSAALANALKNQQIGGAALDVLETEPPAADHPLLNAPNCLVTPHMAWASTEARTRLMNILVENVKQFLQGTPINQVG